MPQSHPCAYNVFLFTALYSSLYSQSAVECEPRESVENNAFEMISQGGAGIKESKNRLGRWGGVALLLGSRNEVVERSAHVHPPMSGTI